MNTITKPMPAGQCAQPATPATPATPVPAWLLAEIARSVRDANVVHVDVIVRRKRPAK